MRLQTDPERPFPLWLVFPLLFSGIYLSHLPLLRLPYYWDEAGYYIPAAYDFFRTGSLIPFTTLTNAHPPLPSIYVALWWRASGFAPVTTRDAMCVLAALALLAVFRLVRNATGRDSLAVATVLLTALYPIWFVQSTLAHADLPAAAATLWGLALYLGRTTQSASDHVSGSMRQKAIDPATSSLAGAALCFSLAVLSKETAIVTPLALSGYECIRACLRGKRTAHLRNAGWLAAPILPLAGWYLYHWRKTGFALGNPEYLRYNATSTLSPIRILLAFAHRILHLTAHMNMFVPVLSAIASVLFLTVRRTDGGHPLPGLSPSVIRPIAIVIGANVVFFSVFGGALLTRYLLPLYPLILMLCVSALWRRTRLWTALAGLSLTAFALGLFFNPPYRFAPEDNLSYRDAIQIQQAAIHEIQTHYPHAIVLTAWPATDELSRPELGYLRQPIPVVAVQNFSLPEIERAATVSEPYTLALVFSTKYDPPRLAWSLGPRNEKWDRRFFDFHRDLPPEQIARLLGGTVVWQLERNGQWAAVLHFDTPQLATLFHPSKPGDD
jgi:4-amino-4-deoxy-L-arabinose transferase-like glycosyltransferase